MSTRSLALLHVALVAMSAAALTGCDGDEPITPVDPSTLAPPPQGEGFQMETEEFQVAAGEEVQDCYFFKVSDLAKSGGLDATKPVNLHRVQAAQRKGSHHMNIFRVRTVVNLGPDSGPVVHGKNGEGECFKSSNWADWPMIANYQNTGEFDWTFPDGVANELLPDEWIMLQTHFVNASTQETPDDAKVRVNFWSMPAEKVTAQMGTIFATKQSIRICQSNQQPMFEGSCQINSPNPVQVIGANGHFHSRGVQFDMYTWDGTSTTTPPAKDLFYTSQKWDEPPMATSPKLDQTIPANGGVWYTCSYQWQMPDPSIGCKGLDDYDVAKHPGVTPDCCYTFGPVVDKNEHCNAFIYYYPKQDDVNCF